jgi:hypothetical protein
VGGQSPVDDYRRARFAAILSNQPPVVLRPKGALGEYPKGVGEQLWTAALPF